MSSRRSATSASFRRPPPGATNTCEEQLIALREGWGGHFPQLTDTLNLLVFSSGTTPLTEAEIKTVITAFTRLVYDALDTYFYVTPTGDDAETYTELEHDEYLDSEGEEPMFILPYDGPDDGLDDHERVLMAQNFLSELRESVHHEVSYDHDGFIRWAWALAICEERFQQYIATTEGLVRYCLERVNFVGSWQFLIQHIVAPATVNAGAERRKYMAFRLCKWIHLAATHPQVCGRNQIAEILETMQDFQIVSRSEEMEHFHLEIYPDRLRLDEYALRDLEGASVVYEKICIADFTHAVPVLSARKCCVICQDDDDPTPFVAFNVCKHAFHANCLSTWAASETSVFTCPLCRAEICVRRRVSEAQFRE